jgi:CelD/BcsL family acetyltransferase involved in cellulose biosynthesis
LQSDPIRVKLHEDPVILTVLEREWTDLLRWSATNTLFQTWEWNQLWWKHFGLSEGFFLLTIRDAGDRLVGIAPLFFDPIGEPPRRLQFIGGIELSDYLDFIVRRGSETSFFSALVGFLDEHRTTWDLVDLHCLPAESSTLSEFRALCQQRDGWEENLSVEDVCPKTSLPSTWEDFLAGMRQKDRHEIRRKINKLRREAEGYRYHVTTPPDLPGDTEAFLELHRKSGTAKTVFMNPKREAFFREMTETTLHAHWLELSFIETAGKKIAALLSFKYGDTVYVYNSGYDPEFSHWSPGWVLVSHSIQDAIKKGVKLFDFMRGSESYKYRFSARDSEIYRYRVGYRKEHVH